MRVLRVQSLMQKLGVHQFSLRVVKHTYTKQCRRCCVLQCFELVTTKKRIDLYIVTHFLTISLSLLGNIWTVVATDSESVHISVPSLALFSLTYHIIHTHSLQSIRMIILCVYLELTLRDFILRVHTAAYEKSQRIIPVMYLHFHHVCYRYNSFETIKANHRLYLHFTNIVFCV